MYYKGFNRRIASLIIIIILSLIRFTSFAQSRDSNMCVHKYPVKEGYIYLYKERPGSIADPGPCVFIYSKESDVFALTEGKVVRTFKIDNLDKDDLILTKNNDTAVVYGNLDIMYKKVGDTVHKGELIGKLKKGISIDRYELTFSYSVGLKTLVYPQYIDFFKRYKP